MESVRTTFLIASRSLCERSYKGHKHIYIYIYTYIYIYSPNSFPAIGVLAGLIERRCWHLDAGPMAGGRVRAIFDAIYLTW